MSICLLFSSTLKTTISITKTINRYNETNSPKSKSGIRDIEINKATILMLKQYKKRQQVQSWQLGRSEIVVVVFSVFTERYVETNALRKRLKKHFKAAGVSDIGFHGFRHIYATIMLYSGMEPKYLQYRLGHSNISMTLDTYCSCYQRGSKKSRLNIWGSYT